jgi:hypothetical protein
LLDHPIKAMQVFREAVQLPRGAGESLRKRLNKYSLDRHHLHFLGTLIDCAPDGAKLMYQIGTVDLENLGVISFQQVEQLIRGFWVNSGASISLINHRPKSRGCATVLDGKTPDKRWEFGDPRSRCHNQDSLRSPFHNDIPLRRSSGKSRRSRNSDEESRPAGTEKMVANLLGKMEYGRSIS